MKIKAGERPAIGVRAMCALAIGWTDGDGSGSAGHRVEDYFDAAGRYLGPDAHGIEPLFRAMTPDEIDAAL